MIRVSICLLSLGAALFTVLALYRHGYMLQQNRDPRVHVALLGASIGQAWHLSGWAQRVGNRRFSVESLAEWSFDKSSLVEDVLRRPAVRFRPSWRWPVSLLRPPHRPEIVILKECSSYFPGDLAAYTRRVREWVGRLENNGLRVVLATVVPITERRAAADPGKLEGVLAYNRWVRDLAREKGIPVLDLEAALRGPDGRLSEEYAAEDGSHLNTRAYARLDGVLLELLARRLSASPAPVAHAAAD